MGLLITYAVATKRLFTKLNTMSDNFKKSMPGYKLHQLGCPLKNCRMCTCPLAYSQDIFYFNSESDDEILNPCITPKIQEKELRRLKLLQNINLCSVIHKNYKTRILNTLLKANKDLAPQGSQEWLDMRVYNIGGSEMSVISHENPYSSIGDLVAQKVTIDNFD